MSTINDIINLGFSYHQSGKFTEAELAYNEALNLDSENAEVHNLLSVLKLQQNETDDAIMLAERAIQLNPCEYYYETLFQAYIRAGAYNKIIALKDIILSKYSKNFSLFFFIDALPIPKVGINLNSSLCLTVFEEKLKYTKHKPQYQYFSRRSS